MQCRARNFLQGDRVLAEPLEGGGDIPNARGVEYEATSRIIHERSDLPLRRSQAENRLSHRDDAYELAGHDEALERWIQRDDVNVRQTKALPEPLSRLIGLEEHVGEPQLGSARFELRELRARSDEQENDPGVAQRRCDCVVISTFMLWSWWGLSLTLLIAGLGIAPALAVLFAIVSASVKFSDTAEAYGWVGTGQLIGAALGSAVAGFLIDSSGAIGAFWVAGAFALVGFIVPALAHRFHPDLRGRDASPIPDTEPVPVQPS